MYVCTYEYAYMHACGYVDRYGYDCLYMCIYISKYLLNYSSKLLKLNGYKYFKNKIKEVKYSDLR